MLPQMLEKSADTPRDTLFWAIVSMLVVGQLAAFWMLCSQQVRKAEVRGATLKVERMAVADCLRHIPQATLDSCAATVATQGQDPNRVLAAGNKPSDSKRAGRPVMSSAVPVSLALR